MTAHLCQSFRSFKKITQSRRLHLHQVDTVSCQWRRGQDTRFVRNSDTGRQSSSAAVPFVDSRRLVIYETERQLEPRTWSSNRCGTDTARPDRHRKDTDLYCPASRYRRIVGTERRPAAGRLAASQSRSVGAVRRRR